MDKAKLELERCLRMQAWKGRYAEPLDLVPVELWSIVPGSIVRHWFAPNKARFVVVGKGKNRVPVVGRDGSVACLPGTSWVVILSGPPADFEDLSDPISKFEAEMKLRAWAGRE